MSRTREMIAALAVLVGALGAQAGPLWGYQSPTNSSVLSPGAAAGLTFPNTTWTDGPANGRIAASPVETWSLAPAATPDPVAATPYSFDLQLKDYASGQTGLLTFRGILDGSIWKTGSALTNTVTGPATGTLDLGANEYRVTVDGFDAPTGFGDAGAGQILATVSVTTAAGATEGADGPTTTPTTAQTPEPATATLAGLAALAGLGWRIRRRPAR